MILLVEIDRHSVMLKTDSFRVLIETSHSGAVPRSQWISYLRRSRVKQLYEVKFSFEPTLPPPGQKRVQELWVPKSKQAKLMPNSADLGSDALPNTSDNNESHEQGCQPGNLGNQQTLCRGVAISEPIDRKVLSNMVEGNGKEIFIVNEVRDSEDEDDSVGSLRVKEAELRAQLQKSFLSIKEKIVGLVQ